MNFMLLAPLGLPGCAEHRKGPEILELLNSPPAQHGLVIFVESGNVQT